MTNDDAAMSMRAHGYGSFDYGSPYLIFSSVLWGYIVRLIPTVYGVLGYSIAMYSVLCLSAALTAFFLVRLGVNRGRSAIITFSAYFIAFTLPQFSITSGLLAATGFLALQSYKERRYTYYLIAFVLLCFLSFIIRWNQFLFICIIAFPLIFSPSLTRDRIFLGFAFILASSLYLSYTVEKHAYDRPEWREFRDFNDARVPFSDYGMSDRLSGTAAARRLGYSDNDLALLKQWFFVDVNIAHPSALRELTTSISLGPDQNIRDHLHDGYRSVVGVVKDRKSVWLTALIGLALLFHRSRRIFISMCVLLSILFYIGFSGRPVPLRVYYPGLVLIAFFSVLYYSGTGRSPTRPKELRHLLHLTSPKVAIQLFATVLSALYGPYSVAIESKAKYGTAQNFRDDFMELAPQLLITWGGHFPYEYVYTPLDRSAHTRKIDFYSLGSSTLAPSSKAYRLEKNESTRFLTMLFSKDGVTFVGITGNEIPDNGNSLRVYCRERYDSSLEVVHITRYRNLSLIQLRCPLP